LSQAYNELEKQYRLKEQEIEVLKRQLMQAIQQLQVTQQQLAVAQQRPTPLPAPTPADHSQEVARLAATIQQLTQERLTLQGDLQKALDTAKAEQMKASNLEKEQEELLVELAKLELESATLKGKIAALEGFDGGGSQGNSAAELEADE